MPPKSKSKTSSDRNCISSLQEVNKKLEIWISHLGKADFLQDEQVTSLRQDKQQTEGVLQETGKFQQELSTRVREVQETILKLLKLIQEKLSNRKPVPASEQMVKGVTTNEERTRFPATPLSTAGSKDTKVKITQIKEKFKREANHAKLMQDFVDLGKFAASLNQEIQDDMDKVNDTLAELKRLDAEKLREREDEKRQRQEKERREKEERDTQREEERKKREAEKEERRRKREEEERIRQEKEKEEARQKQAAEEERRRKREEQERLRREKEKEEKKKRKAEEDERRRKKEEEDRLRQEKEEEERRRQEAEEAEKRRLEEEERLRREEEERRIKEEEERKRREEEERKKREEEERRRKAEEERRRREAEERARLEMERQKEEERKSRLCLLAKNEAPKVVYHKDGADDTDHSAILCVIRTFDDTFSQDMVKVTEVKSDGVLGPMEELVSLPVRVSCSTGQLGFPNPSRIAFPHVASKHVHPAKQLVIKRWKDGRWQYLDTSNIHMTDYQGMSFVETELETVYDEIYVVAMKHKEDSITIKKNKKGEISSTADPRIKLVIEPGSSDDDLKITMQVIPVEQDVIADTNTKLGRDYVKACGSMVKVSVTPTPKKPVVLHIPKPGAGSTRKNAWPETAAGNADASQTSVMTKKAGGWEMSENIIIGKNNDLMCTVEIDNEGFVCLVTPGGTSPYTLNKSCRQIEERLSLYRVHMLACQSNVDPSQALISCCRPDKLDSVLTEFRQQAFTECSVSEEPIILGEGQVVTVSSSGNVLFDDDDVFTVKFFSWFPVMIPQKLKVKDVYAQKALTQYRGQVDFGLEADRDPGGVNNVSSLLVTLPKEGKLKPRAEKARYKPRGPIDEELLQEIADQLGESWIDVAKELGIAEARIKAVRGRCETNTNTGEMSGAKQMLMGWHMRTGITDNKASELCAALNGVSRSDLADDVEKKCAEYEADVQARKRAQEWDKVFQVAYKNVLVYQHWEILAEHLGLPETEIDSINRNYKHRQEKCREALKTWLQSAGKKATRHALGGILQMAGHNDVASKIKALKTAL